MGARALYSTSTKRQRKVKRTNVSIRNPIQAVEMWERGPYIILPNDRIFYFIFHFFYLFFSLKINKILSAFFVVVVCIIPVILFYCLLALL